MPPTFASVIAAFGASAKDKLSNLGASGQPEDQLRAPFEKLLADLADLAGVRAVSAVGEYGSREDRAARGMDAAA